MSGTEFQKQFLARLLLVSAQAAGSHQGSTSCTSSDVHMTLPIDLMGGREPRRRSHASYIVDSGASLHCINDINLFDSIYQDHRPVKLRVANGKILVSHAVGSVKINLQRQDGTTHSILIHNVVYHPEFSHNLLSVRRLWKDNGLKARFGDKNYFKCKNTNEKFSFAFDREFKVQSVSAITSTTQIGADLLHSKQAFRDPCPSGRSYVRERGLRSTLCERGFYQCWGVWLLSPRAGEGGGDCLVSRTHCFECFSPLIRSRSPFLAPEPTIPWPDDWNGCRTGRRRGVERRTGGGGGWAARSEQYRPCHAGHTRSNLRQSVDSE